MAASISSDTHSPAVPESGGPEFALPESDAPGSAAAGSDDLEAFQPPAEHEKGERQHRIELHEEADHGRHGIDRSRPETIVRHNR